MAAYVAGLAPKLKNVLRADRDRRLAFDVELSLAKMRLPHEARIRRYPNPLRRNAEEVCIKLVIPVLVMDDGHGIDAVFQSLVADNHLAIGDGRLALAHRTAFDAIRECLPVRAFGGKDAEKNLSLVASEVVDRDCQVGGGRLRKIKNAEQHSRCCNLDMRIHRRASAT